MDKHAEIEVVIDGIGAQGDGVATTPEGRVFVPFTAPGDRVRVRLREQRKDGIAADLVAIVAPAAQRVTPPCRHFGTCGGCDLQHVRGHDMLAWKRGQVEAALAHRGLSAPVEPVVATPPAERRRARLSARREGEHVTLGFRARASHRIIDVAHCPLLAPALDALMPPLRELGLQLLGSNGEAVFEATATDTGIDLLLESPSPLGPTKSAAVARFAERQRLARVAWRADADAEPELVAMLATPVVRFADVPVAIPPGAFLQASPTAQAALTAAVLRAADGARRVADLFAGVGAFTFPLGRLAPTHAVEGDAAAAEALAKAARDATVRVSVEHRDLARRPLQVDELKRFDFVALDPPRVGARAQAEALAKSRVAAIAYVSCNPATFARDARVLVDGGWRIERVLPVDQFLWSAHVELAAILRR